MDKNNAIEILKALAYCSIKELSCDDCPMLEKDDAYVFGSKCRGWTDEDIIKAVEALK